MFDLKNKIFNISEKCCIINQQKYTFNIDLKRQELGDCLSYLYTTNHVIQVQKYILYLFLEIDKLKFIKNFNDLNINQSTKQFVKKIRFDFNNFKQVYLRSLNHDSDKFTNKEFINDYNLIICIDNINTLLNLKKDQNIVPDEDTNNKIIKARNKREKIHYINQRHHFYFKGNNCKNIDFLDIMEAVCDCAVTANNNGNKREFLVDFLQKNLLINQSELIKKFFIDFTILLYSDNENLPDVNINDIYKQLKEKYKDSQEEIDAIIKYNKTFFNKLQEIITLNSAIEIKEQIDLLYGSNKINNFEQKDFYNHLLQLENDINNIGNKNCKTQSLM